METPVGAPHERVELAVNPEGRVELVVGVGVVGVVVVVGLVVGVVV